MKSHKVVDVTPADGVEIMTGDGLLALPRPKFRHQIPIRDWIRDCRCPHWNLVKTTALPSPAMQATDPIRAISHLLASASLGGRAGDRASATGATPPPPNLLASCTRHVRLRVRRGREGGMLGGDADGGMD